jgi:hypothetical protein
MDKQTLLIIAVAAVVAGVLIYTYRKEGLGGGGHGGGGGGHGGGGHGGGGGHWGGGGRGGRGGRFRGRAYPGWSSGAWLGSDWPWWYEPAYYVDLPYVIDEDPCNCFGMYKSAIDGGMNKDVAAGKLKNCIQATLNGLDCSTF